MIFGACVCVLLKVFSLSDAAVSASGSAGVCRRSVLRSLLLNGVDWGPSVWHRWWRIPLSFQKQHSGVSMTYRLLSVCVPWFHCSSFHRKLIFFMWTDGQHCLHPNSCSSELACSSWSSLWPRAYLQAKCLRFSHRACQQPLVHVAPCLQKAAEWWAVTIIRVKRKYLIIMPY